MLSMRCVVIRAFGVLAAGCVEEAATELDDASQGNPDGFSGLQDSGSTDGGFADGNADSALGQHCGIGGQHGPLCPEGFFCYTGPGFCLSFDWPFGYCVPVPDECPEDMDEVCGCSGTTYQNACAADMARADVLFQDACDSACTSDEDCSENALCVAAEFPEVSPDSCDVTEGGRCMDFSRFCEVSPFESVVIPVCGCDGRTYENLCYAFLEGRTNIAHEGACEIDGGV